MKKVGIIRYPCSNCDLETSRYFKINNESECILYLA